jgi:hypothetical protein
MASIRQEGSHLQIQTTHYQAAFQSEGYVRGVAEGSFVDRQTGAQDPGFGLLIADFLLAPGPDHPGTPPECRYGYGNLSHGQIAKRFVALPQICTQAGRLDFQVTQGAGFVAVRQWRQWDVACPPYPPGARWEQHLLFPDGVRWFLGWDRFMCPFDAPCVMMRMDMPGHLRHSASDSFQQIYLSYVGAIPAQEFANDFPPDERLLYRRSEGHLPNRFIRAMQLANGTWLAVMALDPASVYEACFHQRGYVCFIEEFGGRPVRAGEWVGAVHLVGYFDSIPEMSQAFDAHRGATALRYSPEGWSLK